MSRLWCMTGLCLLLTGCERARSFLHMDSNNPTPFLGFQLSVDAGGAKSDDVAVLPASARTSQAMSEPSDSGADGNGSVSVAAGGRSVRNTGFTPTSDVSRQAATVKYALPQIDLSRHADEAVEVEDLVSRIAN